MDIKELSEQVIRAGQIQQQLLTDKSSTESQSVDRKPKKTGFFSKFRKSK